MQRNLVLVDVQKVIHILHVGRQFQTAGGRGNNVTLYQSLTIDVSLTENRIFSVLDSIGIVYSKVVKIIGVVPVDGTVFLPELVVDALVEHDCKEKFSCFAGHAVRRIQVVFFIRLHGNLIECADIHRKIMPAGFVNVVINIFGFHDTYYIIRIKYTISIGVGLIVPLYPALNIIFGYIEPETDSACVFKFDCIACAKSDPSILFRVRVLGRQTVGFQTHGVIAVMNLTVRTIRQRQIQVIIPVCGVLTVVDSVPLVNIRLTILKVPKNYRASSQIQLYSGCRAVTEIQGSGYFCSNIFRSICFGNSSKEQTVKLSESLIGRGKCYIVYTKTDFLRRTLYGRICLYGNLCGLTKRNRNDRLSKFECIGSSNVYGLFTDNIAVIDHLNSYLPLSTVGGEHTILDGTHTFFFDLPHNVIGNLNLGTYGIGAECIKGYGSTRGIVVVIGRNGCLSKLAVRRSGGNNQERVGGRTFTTVGERAVHLQFFPRTLRTERGGTTAVTVCGNDTPHLDHVLSHFITGEPRGIGCLFTVGDSKYKFPLCCYTNKGSGSNAGTMVFFILVHRIPIFIGLNKICKQNGDRLFFPTGQWICSVANPCLGHIIGSFFAGNRMIIIVDNSDCLDTTGYRTFYPTAVSIQLPIKDRISERFTYQVRIFLVVSLGIPAQRSVGRYYHVAIAKCFSFQCLHRGRLGTVVVFFRPHSLGTRDHLNKVIVKIDNSGMHNLSAGTCIVVHNDFSFRDSGSKSPLFLGNDIIVITSAVAVIISC